jgi:hypothetical protein
MNQKYYITRDLYLSCFLLLNNLPIERTELNNAIVYFYFIENPKLYDLTLKFFNGSAKVDPLRYIEIVKRVRRMIQNITIK